eukprot:CAMPEP_0179155762 /NCGR_PEP_ID=MMETSP0796-20121207/75893_1 /TAXON_ID=73915 /ORGANISM="Pyrodinium bahamense, Strain pbaha01" /LENGTH=57 /DNA_ID=CAMNT_0020857275 /DNA_START=30 /DNA_END=200 /DNA_ORIENTATION=-
MVAQDLAGMLVQLPLPRGITCMARDPFKALLVSVLARVSGTAKSQQGFLHGQLKLVL